MVSQTLATPCEGCRDDPFGDGIARVGHSAAIALLSWPSVRVRLTPHEWLFGAYGLISLVGFARGFYSPAVSSLRPFLVPLEIYGNSATWASTFFQTGAIAWPVSAGVLFESGGRSVTLMVVTVVFAR